MLSIICGAIFILVGMAAYFYAVKKVLPHMAVMGWMGTGFGLTSLKPDLPVRSPLFLLWMAVFGVVAAITLAMDSRKKRREEEARKLAKQKAEEAYAQTVEDLFRELAGNSASERYIHGVLDYIRRDAERDPNNESNGAEVEKALLARAVNPKEKVLVVMVHPETPLEVLVRIPRAYRGYLVYVRMSEGFEPFIEGNIS